MRKQNWETASRLTSHDEQLIGMRRFRNVVEESSSTYEWIDLGLPSGLLWASTNVGAEKPEDFGLYFAWGETEGYEGVTIDKQFSWSDYELCNGSDRTLTKYNTNSHLGTVDNLTTLEQVDDAAYQADSSCRIPTRDECQELIDNTTSTWETLNGVNGRRFISKTNGNSIFVPAAGCCLNGSVAQVSYSGCFYSSSLDENSIMNVWSLLFDLSNVGMTLDVFRCYGLTVRAVKSIN